MSYVVIRTVDRETVIVGKSNSRNEAVQVMKKDFEPSFNEWYDKEIFNNPTDVRGMFLHGKETTLSMEDKLSQCKEEETAFDADSGKAYLNNYNGWDWDWNILDVSDCAIQFAPLSFEEILKTMNEGMYVSGNVLMEINDLIYGDLESTLDILSEKLVGTPLLSDISYKAVDTYDDMIVVQVRGCVDMLIDDLLEDHWEIFKDRLQKNGKEAVSDFCGTDVELVDKGTCDEQIEESKDQMSQEDLLKFYQKYYC